MNKTKIKSMAKKHALLILSLLVIVIIGVGAFVYKPSNLGISFFSNQDAASKAKVLYELANPGMTISVIKVEDISGMYKVYLKAIDSTGTANYRETYITKDGQLLTENVILVNESISQITRVHDFVDCLDTKGLKILGISNQTGTILQFNLLGGSYATKLYVSCDGEFAQQCVNAGITQVPSTVYGNQGYPGVQPLTFFENLTQCKY